MLRIAVPFAGTLILLGMETNSKGLVVIEFLVLDSSLLEESVLFKGPQIIADYLAKVKSISRSYGPLFLNGILNF